MRPYHILHLSKLLKAPWKNLQSIKKLQETKLKKLIHHAYQKVPYYRNLFNSLNIKPEDIRSSEDLRHLSLTSKQHLQALPLKEKLAKGVDVKQCKSLATSGTTGVPLEMYYTRQDSTLMSLSWARAFLSSGMKPWHRMTAFIGQQNVKTKTPWYEHFRLWQRRELSTWNKPEDWIEEIRKWNPQVLIGYMMTLKLLGEAIQECHTEDIRPKVIFLSSGILDDLSRQFLESVFHAKIIDIYGSDEAGCIAWECPTCSGYHISSDMVIVEVLKNGKPVSPGEEGEVVITNLHSYAMPFIRYQQDDIATLSDKISICGRAFPLLEQIKGRVDDFIILRNGQKISPTPFYHSIDPVPGVKRWKITQENIHEIMVEIEPGKKFTIDTQTMIRNNLQKLVKGEVEIRIILVDSIPINPSTKFRTVTSRVSKNL